MLDGVSYFTYGLCPPSGDIESVAYFTNGLLYDLVDAQTGITVGDVDGAIYTNILATNVTPAVLVGEVDAGIDEFTVEGQDLVSAATSEDKDTAIISQELDSLIDAEDIEFEEQ